MDHLLAKFPPGMTTPPHRYVTLTFAAIAQHNALAFVTFLADILSRTSKLLPHLKGDEQRSIWAQAICAFCESILEFSSSPNTSGGRTGTGGEGDSSADQHSSHTGSSDRASSILGGDDEGEERDEQAREVDSGGEQVGT